jgi:hypothetical protein
MTSPRRNLSDIITEELSRDYSVWHVRHRLKKSFRSFKSEVAALEYFKSMKHCKTRRIDELRPPKELMIEAFNAPNPLLRLFR